MALLVAHIMASALMFSPKTNAPMILLPIGPHQGSPLAGQQRQKALCAMPFPLIRSATGDGWD
jgi:hypothetical protein